MRKEIKEQMKSNAGHRYAYVDIVSLLDDDIYILKILDFTKPEEELKSIAYEYVNSECKNHLEWKGRSMMAALHYGDSIQGNIEDIDLKNIFYQLTGSW